MYGFTKLYAGEGSRIPPTSTPEGKQARIVGGVILTILVAALVFQIGSGGSNTANILTSIEAVLIGAIFAVARYFKSKKKKK